MPDELFGVFHEEKGVGVGATYSVGLEGEVPKRWKGKQILAGAQVTGKGKDAMLDKTLQLTLAGDTYVEPSALQRELEKRSGPGPVSTKPFKPTNPPSKAGRGVGSLNGTFGPPSQLLDTDATLGRMSGRVPITPLAGKRNIYVNVPKKGSFGFPDQDRTLGSTKYQYMPDEYARGRILEKEMKAEARKKMSKAFMGSPKTTSTFSSDASIYAWAPNPEAPKGRLKPEGERGSSRGAVWKNPNPAQKGPGHGTINRLEYVASPLPEAEYHAKENAAIKAFKPVGSCHKRLSMWAVNPYSYEARPAADNDCSFL